MNAHIFHTHLSASGARDCGTVSVSGAGPCHQAHRYHLLSLHPLYTETICERQRARSAWLPPSWQDWRPVQRCWPRPLAPLSSSTLDSTHWAHLSPQNPCACVSLISRRSHSTWLFLFPILTSGHITLDGSEHWACPAPKHTCGRASPSLAQHL